MTNGEIVSRIVNDLSHLTKDVHISRRWILRILTSKVETYIAQKWAEGSLFDEESLFTYINCVEMIKIRSIDCCIEQFKICETLMRSKHRIPGIAFTRIGPTILAVTNADRSIYFKKIDPMEYRVTRKRKYGHLEKYSYYYRDGYIWIPDTHIELINVDAITFKKKEALAISACGDKDEFIECPTIWEDDFICPEKLREYIVAETIQEVSMRLQIPKDEDPNMDSNLRTEGQQQQQ